MDRRKSFLALLVLAAASAGALAQPAAKVWRIGFLETTSMARNAANLDAFVKGMRELGYVEGRHFVVDYRSADGRVERFPDLAAELVRAKVDLIVARGTPAVQAIQKVSTAVPVVASALGSPLLLVKSYARPGGNVTGLSSVVSDLAAKRIELLKEVSPGVARVGMLSNSANPAAQQESKEAERAARSLGVETILLDVRRSEDFPRAFDEAVKRRATAMVVQQDGLIQQNGRLIAELAAQHRLPALYASNEYVDDGGLISLGVSYADLYRRAAYYVDKILKGANPGELAIEQPTKFDLTINRRTAKALGITIPPALLVRADRVVD